MAVSKIEIKREVWKDEFTPRVYQEADDTANTEILLLLCKMRIPFMYV